MYIELSGLSIIDWEKRVLEVGAGHCAFAGNFLEA